MTEEATRPNGGGHDVSGRHTFGEGPSASGVDVRVMVDRLEQSLADVLYAVAITPKDWLYRSPGPDHYDPRVPAWNVAQNLAHLAVYEEQIAAPILEALAAGTDAAAAVISVMESDYDDLWERLAIEPIDVIAERLRVARSRQIRAIAAMSDDQFHSPGTTLWEELREDGHSAAWVATKTFQHTWDHGNSIFQVALFMARESRV